MSDCVRACVICIYIYVFACACMYVWSIGVILKVYIGVNWEGFRRRGDWRQFQQHWGTFFYSVDFYLVFNYAFIFRIAYSTAISFFLFLWFTFDFFHFVKKKEKKWSVMDNLWDLVDSLCWTKLQLNFNSGVLLKNLTLKISNSTQFLHRSVEEILDWDSDRMLGYYQILFSVFWCTAACRGQYISLHFN